MLKKIFKIHLLVFGLVGLTACATTPQDIGISEGQWQQYDKAKQEKLMKDYEKLGEENKLEDQSALDQYQQLKDGTYAGNYLKVKLYDGKAMMPPFVDWYRFKETAFEIIPNTCTNVFLEEELADSKANHVSMRACYKNNILSLDLSRFNANQSSETARFSSSPLWNSGFTYRNINTNGYVRLKDVTVNIKKQMNN